MINVFIIDDHDFFIQGVSMALTQADDDVHVAGSANSCREALLQICELDVDVVLLDILMPEMNGIECCKRIKNDFPQIKVIGLTGEVDPKLMMELWRQSADAILLKSDGLEDLTAAIKNVMKNRQIFTKDVPQFMVHTDEKLEVPPRLTHREYEVLQLLGTGLSRKEVANELNLSQYSVDFHCKNIFKKFNDNKIHTIIAEAKKARIIP
jgi:DNA-binding NarL/FixJ family response regulator